MDAFVCEQCGISFTARRSLLRHQKKHEAETFTCDQFEGSYKTERGLKEHKSKAHSSKSYSCSSCPKTFASKVYLTQHKQTHNKEKLFECEYCFKNFSTAATMKRHYLKCRIIKTPIEKSCAANDYVMTCNDYADRNAKIYVFVTSIYN